jgi:hypothetical protein
MYKKNIDNFLGTIKDHFERMTSNHILCAVRYPGGITVVRLMLQAGQGSGSQMFSGQAMDAYRRASEDQDFGPLSRIFDETQMQYFKDRLGMPSEDDMDKVRRMLNSMGGSFPLRGAGGGRR